MANKYANNGVTGRRMEENQRIREVERRKAPNFSNVRMEEEGQIADSSTVPNQDDLAGAVNYTV